MIVRLPQAVALGARAVFVGRPLLWGLAAGGKQGAMAVLDILHKEFVAAMKLTGCTRVEDIRCAKRCVCVRTSLALL